MERGCWEGRWIYDGRWFYF